MSLIGQMVGQVAKFKTLEQEIVDVLGAAADPISCAEISERIPNPPDRETLSREVFNLTKSGRIVKVGDMPAPAGVPRKTVAVYRLADRGEGEQQPSDAPSPAQVSEPEKKATSVLTEREPSVAGRDSENKTLSVLRFLAQHREPVSAADVANALGWKRQVVWNAFTWLYKKGKVDFYVTGHTRYYSLTSETNTSPPAHLPADQLPVSETTAAAGDKAPLTSSFSPAVPKETPVPAAVPPAPAREDAQAEFGLFSSVRMTITKGNQLMFLDREETLRLRQFLGCFEIETN